MLVWLMPSDWLFVIWVPSGSSTWNVYHVCCWNNCVQFPHMSMFPCISSFNSYVSQARFHSSGTSLYCRLCWKMKWMKQFYLEHTLHPEEIWGSGWRAVEWWVYTPPPRKIKTSVSPLSHKRTKGRTVTLTSVDARWLSVAKVDVLNSPHLFLIHTPNYQGNVFTLFFNSFFEQFEIWKLHSQTSCINELQVCFSSGSWRY